MGTEIGRRQAAQVRIQTISTRMAFHGSGQDVEAWLNSLLSPANKGKAEQPSLTKAGRKDRSKKPVQTFAQEEVIAIPGLTLEG